MLSSYVSCVCVLVALIGVARSCDKNITVSVSESANLVLPQVNLVEFTVYNEFNESSFSDVQATITDFSTPYSMSFSLKSSVFTVNVRFDQSAITCQHIILSRNITLTNYTCVPISSCGSDTDTDITSVQWQRRTNTDSPYQPLGNESFLSISSTEDIVNDTLSIRNIVFDAAGYYQVMVPDSDIVLHNFTFYYFPKVLYHSPNSTADNGTTAPHVFDCLYTAFPTPTITWSFKRNISGNSIELLSNSKYSMSNITVANITDPPITNNLSEALTVNGRLTIRDVVYSDAGYFSCEASFDSDNENATQTTVLRFRVKDPLRALYPAMGTIASFIVTALIILCRLLFDKFWEAKKKSSTEVDALFRRHQSVISNNEDEATVFTKASNRRSLQPLVSKT